MKIYDETGISNDIMKTMLEQLNYGWDASLSKDAVKMLVEGLAAYLGHVKTRKEVKAAIIEDKNGIFHFGAFVEFIESEQGKGGFTLTFTFDSDDIKPEYSAVTVANPVLHHILSDMGFKHGIIFEAKEGQEFISPTMCVVADSIKNYLHANVAIDPKLQLDQFFEANAELDGDKVYYSLTPLEIVKQHVKGDAENETAA